MRKLLTILALFARSSVLAMPGPTINGNQINPQSAISIATFTVTGAAPVNITGGVNAATAALTATGNSTFSLVTSSGIQVQNGTLSVKGFGGIDARGTGVIASTITLSGSNGEQWLISDSANFLLNQWFGISFNSGGDNSTTFRMHYGAPGVGQQFIFQPANTTEIIIGQSSNSQYSLSVTSGVAISAGGLKFPDGTIQYTKASGTGGGGLSSITITSVTASGGSIISLYGPGISTPGFALDGAGLTLSSSGVIGVKNLMFAASSATLLASDFTGTNTSYSTAFSSVTLNTGNNPVRVRFMGGISNQNTNLRTCLVLLVDGAFASVNDNTHGFCHPQIPGSSTLAMTTDVEATVTVSAGPHTFAIGAFAPDSGTWQVYRGGTGNVAKSELRADEIITSGSSYSAPASTWTQLSGTVSAFTNTIANCDSTGSTVTLTMRGGRMLIGFEGQANNSVKDSLTHVGVMVDGQLIDGETATALFSPAQAAAASDRWNAGFTHLTQSTYTGSHSVCLAKVVGANTGAICDNSGNACRLWVKEDLNAAGTGDVSSNGTNNLSGANTFTGTVNGTIYHSSFTVMANGDQSITATTQGTEQAVTGSTITVQTNTAGEWVDANVTLQSGLGGNVLHSDLIMDGVRVPSQAGSNGSCQWANSASSIMSYSCTVPVLVATAGTHNFSLMAYVSATVTLTKSNPPSYFEVKNWRGN